MVRGRLLVFCLSLVALGACDHAPVDPLDPRVNVASLLLGDGEIGRHTQLSMPGLLHAAIRKVYDEQGANAARGMVADLRRLHDQAQSAMERGDRETSLARLQAVREEEIRIVLRVFGDRLALRVVDAVTGDAAQLRASLSQLEAAGRPLPRARELLSEIDAHLQKSAALMEQGNAAAALDVAARAASAADAIRQLLVDVTRVPTVEVLYDVALERLRVDQRDVAARTDRLQRLQRAADDAVRAGANDRAHEALRAVRAERIAVIVSVLGVESARDLLADVKAGHADATAGVARARAGGRDVYRLERMLETTRDLHARANTALARGDAVTALDLGSHAATLVNAIRTSLSALGSSD